ncbi:hypothetical protein DIPPA_63552 [Diplonema papillatum]|nr:hypothetical protein DIPPA_63552 [Diplonema papillatum]
MDLEKAVAIFQSAVVPIWLSVGVHPEGVALIYGPGIVFSYLTAKGIVRHSYLWAPAVALPTALSSCFCDDATLKGVLRMVALFVGLRIVCITRWASAGFKRNFFESYADCFFNSVSTKNSGLHKAKAWPAISKREFIKGMGFLVVLIALVSTKHRIPLSGSVKYLYVGAAILAALESLSFSFLLNWALVGWRSTPIMNSPWEATTVRGFWGRWDTMVATLLKNAVFEPAVDSLGNKHVAALATFAVSGMLHSIPLATSGKQVPPALLFFLIHGIACSAETALKPRPSILYRAFSVGFIAGTLPLISSPFVE